MEQRNYKNIILSEIKSLFEISENKDLIVQVELFENDLINNEFDQKKLYELSEIIKIIKNEIGAGIISLIAVSLYYLLKDKQECISIGYHIGIMRLYQGLKKVPDVKLEKVEKQSENFIKLLLNITEDVRAVLILTAVQLYKIRHIKNYSDEEKDKILKLTKAIYIPLAHRTGLYNIKTEFEEIHMKFTETEIYKSIAEKLKETKASRDLYIKNFIEPLQKLLEENGYHFKIKGRPKSIHSIWNKMETKGVSFEEVYDLFAIRIILKSDLKNEKIVCWNVYSLITNIYKPNPKRLRDWISAPKLSGYESLHTTVLGPENRWVEVQIRTERMDEIAEKGPASHFQYKSGTAGSGTDWLSKIREAIEKPSDEDIGDDKSKKVLYSDDILVFTPDNDIKSMKKGYTLLDFAFSVHTKVGETCTGGIVNGKIQPLSYELKNGDTIKILTDKNKKPNSEWLKIVKGERTKNKIKRALKAKTFYAAEKGKDLLKEKTERLKIKFNDITIQKISDYFGFKNVIEFFHELGKGNIDIQKIKNAFEQDSEQTAEKNIDIPEEIAETEDYKHVDNDFLLIGDNLSGLNYHFAKCCNPLPGDEIFGFVTVNKGTKIHKRSCPNAKEMFSRFPYRILKAKWKTAEVNSAFAATLILSGTDEKGIVSEISKVINDEFNLRLQALSLKTTDNNSFKGTLIVNVLNRKQLNFLMKRLKMLKGIREIKEKTHS